MLLDYFYTHLIEIIMPTWLFVIACIMLIPYVAVPIFIWRTQRFCVKPSLRQLLTDFLPAAVKKPFNDIQESLTSEQFHYCFDAVSYEHAPAIQLFFRAFVHPTEKVMAIVTAFVAEESHDIECKPFIEFISRFNDGTKLNTHNSDMLGAPIHSSKEISHAFVLVKNPTKLFHIHQHYLRKMLADKEPLLSSSGQEFKDMQQNFAEELAIQAQMGGLRLDAGNEYYRPTWAGAILMAWYSMWPIALIRRFYHNQRSKLWLKRLSSAS